MTINTNDTRNEFTATASQTVFTYDFKIFASTDLSVFQTPAGQECADSDLITAFTVTGVGLTAGGTIVLNTGASVGDLITIVSNIPESRTTDYQTNGDFLPDTVNDDFDRVVSLAKQTQSQVARTPQFQECLQGKSGFSLPTPQTGAFLRTKTDLIGYENVVFSSTPQVSSTNRHSIQFTDGASGIGLSGTSIETFFSVTLVTGDQVITNNYGSSLVGGAILQYTGSTVIGKAGNAPDADGFFYDADGKQFKNVSDILQVTQWGANGDGANDDTSAFQAAIDFFSTGNGTINIPKGTFKITSTVTINQDRINLIGQGLNVSQIVFIPVANDTCFLFTGNVLDQCSIKNLSFNSTDTTFVKTAIEFVDTSFLIVENIAIGPIGGWTDATNSSIGIHTKGRDQAAFKELNIAADFPLRISDNPNFSIDIDHYNFHNCIFFPGTTRPAVLIDSGVNLTNVSFTGFQAWVGGTSGLEWIDTTAVAVSTDLLIENLRTEGADDATAYSINIQHNDNLQGLTLINCLLDSGRKGLFLRQHIGVTLINVKYPSTSREGINIDSTVQGIRGVGCFWQTGSSGTITGQRVVWESSEQPSSGYLPADFLLNSTIQASRNFITDQAFRNDRITLAIDADIDIGTSGLKPLGLLTIMSNQNVSALYAMKGTGNNTIELLESDAGFYTPVKDNANTTNIYFDATSGTYKLQNKSSAERRYNYFLAGSYGSV